jgi:hypothetical protein
MKLTRRKLAAAVLGSAATAMSQTQPTLPASADEELQAARERQRANAQALAGQQVAMPVEPAFQFKA